MKTKTEYERISSRMNLSRRLLRWGYIFLGCLLAHLIIFWSSTRGVDPSWLKGSFIALMVLTVLSFVLSLIIYPWQSNSYKKKSKEGEKTMSEKKVKYLKRFYGACFFLGAAFILVATLLYYLSKNSAEVAGTTILLIFIGLFFLTGSIVADKKILALKKSSMG